MTPVTTSKKSASHWVEKTCQFLAQLCFYEVSQSNITNQGAKCTLVSHRGSNTTQPLTFPALAEHSSPYKASLPTHLLNNFLHCSSFLHNLKATPVPQNMLPSALPLSHVPVGQTRNTSGKACSKSTATHLLNQVTLPTTHIHSALQHHPMPADETTGTRMAQSIKHRKKKKKTW